MRKLTPAEQVDASRACHEEGDGQTRLTSLSFHSGYAAGLDLGYNRLDQLLGSVKSLIQRAEGDEAWWWIDKLQAIIDTYSDPSKIERLPDLEKKMEEVQKSYDSMSESLIKSFKSESELKAAVTIAATCLGGGFQSFDADKLMETNPAVGGAMRMLWPLVDDGTKKKLLAKMPALDTTSAASERKD